MVLVFSWGRPMLSKPKPRKSRESSSSFFLALVVVLAMLLLFLRMVAFVAGHHRL